jgi:hypothetical protein
MRPDAGVHLYYVDGVFAHEPVADPIFRRPEGPRLCGGRSQDAFELAPPRMQVRPLGPARSSTDHPASASIWPMLRNDAPMTIVSMPFDL